MFDRVLNMPLKVLQNTSIEVVASKHLIRFSKSTFPDAATAQKKRRLKIKAKSVSYVACLLIPSKNFQKVIAGVKSFSFFLKLS